MTFTMKYVVSGIPTGTDSMLLVEQLRTLPGVDDVILCEFGLSRFYAYCLVFSERFVELRRVTLETFLHQFCARTRVLTCGRVDY